VTGKGLEQFLPTSVQKSYFMLSGAERDVVNTALEKYRPGQSKHILVRGRNVLKPALRLMTNYRLVIEEIKDGEVISSYTRWVDAVQVKGADNQEVLFNIQSALRAHLARIEEATCRLCYTETGEHGTPKPVCSPIVWLGEKSTSGSGKSVFQWSNSTSARARVSKNADWKYHPAGAFRGMGEPAPTRFEYRHFGDHKADLNVAFELERSKHRRVMTLTFSIK
jgi:hypothetical protein